jgi:uncharacterized membrane protein (DUF106 family)
LGALTGLFTLLLKPFEGGHALGGLIFISILTGGVMLFLFRFTSNQAAMKEVKTRISAYFLELRLYSHDISNVIASQGKIMRSNLSYMKLSLIPAVVMIVPVILVMVQLNLRYANQQLRPGDTALVKVKVAEGYDVMRNKIEMECGSGLEKASPGVRIPSLGEVCYKVRLTEPGIHTFKLGSGGTNLEMPVYGSDRLVPVYGIAKKTSIGEAIFNPGAPRVPADAPIESVEVVYEPMEFRFPGFSLSWLWAFLFVSFAFGICLKFIFKVE